MLHLDVPSQPAAPPVGAAESGGPSPSCTNCGSAQVSAYCAECGERQPSRHDFSLRALVVDAVLEVISIDGRVTSSVLALVARPGLMTREWFEGRRGRYVKPFSLFLLLNVAFFLVQPHTGLLSYGFTQYTFGASTAAQHRRSLAEAKRATRHETPAEFQTRFDAQLQDQKKTLMVFCVPVLALGLTLLYAGRRRYLAEHLVFSVHTYAFLLLFLTVGTPIILLAGARGLVALGAPGAAQFLDSDGGLTILLGIVIGWYLVTALRRVYGDRLIPALLRAGVLFYLIGALTNVYHDVLFYTTLYSL